MDQLSEQSEIAHNQSVQKLKQEHFDSLDAGKNKIIQEVKDGLEKSSKKPQVIFINGQAGAGKSYLSGQVKDDLANEGIRAIFIETDMYHEEEGREIYTHKDFFEQKQAWEAGKDFEYFDTERGQKETARGGELDVIIIGGIGANPEATGIKSLTDVFVTSPFLTRLANKGLRDHIVHADTPTLEQFMDEICDPGPENDLLQHLYNQEKDSSEILKNSGIIIQNIPLDQKAKIYILGEMLVFEAEYEGKKYQVERPISPLRIELLHNIISINDPVESQKIDETRESRKRVEEGREILAIKAGLGLPVPQPGESSGKTPLVDGIDGKLVRSENLTLEEIFASKAIDQSSIPYYQDVYQDVIKGDLDWEVTKKVKEYADYLAKNPETLGLLPPVQFLNNKLHDGAHRLSAIYLLSKLYPDSQWPTVKLKVDFYEGKIER